MKFFGIGGFFTKGSIETAIVSWGINLPIKDLVMAIIMAFTGWTPGEFDPVR